MKRCRRTWLVLLALTCLGLAMYFEPTRCVRGWLDGEAFFAARPTSYWRAVVEEDLQRDPVILVREVFNPTPPTWWQQVRARLGLNARPHSSLRFIVYDSKYDVNRDETQGMFAVLKVLAEDPNEKIAGFAADAPKLTPWSMPESYWIGLIGKHSLRKRD